MCVNMPPKKSPQRRCAQSHINLTPQVTLPNSTYAKPHQLQFSTSAPGYTLNYFTTIYLTRQDKHVTSVLYFSSTTFSSLCGLYINQIEFSQRIIL